MASYSEDLTYKMEEPIKKVIFEITNLIKYKNDYESAIRIILENNLKLEDIVNTTSRLKRDQLVSLSSRLISVKNWLKEENMESIIYELRANDVKEEDIKTIMENVKNRISEENIDIELQKLGYAKIFTIDYDSYEYGVDEDDEY